MSIPFINQVQSFLNPPSISDPANFETNATECVKNFPRFIGQVNALNLFGLAYPFGIQYGFTASIASGVVTKIGVVPGSNNSGWDSGTPKFSMVQACILGAGAANYSAYSFFLTDGVSVSIPSHVDGTLLTITLSGTDIMVTNNSGTTQIVYWAIFSF